MNRKTNAIEKALQIIQYTANDHREKGIQEISESLAIPKSTASRIISALVEYRFLRRNPATRKYRPGVWLASVGLNMFQDNLSDFIFFAKPYIDELRDLLDITINFLVLCQDEVFFAYSAENHTFLHVEEKVGKIIPYHCAASGKAILAHLPSEKRRAIFKKDLHKYTMNTITESEKLKRHLKDVKTRGFATDMQEYILGTYGVSVPILGESKKIIGAVATNSLSPFHELTLDSPIVSSLKETAQKISQQFVTKF